MQCISKEDENFVLLHQGEIGNKLRRLIKLELFFYKKQMSPPLRNQKKSKHHLIKLLTEIMLIFQANNPNIPC